MNHLSLPIAFMFQEASRASTALEGIRHPDLSKFLVIAAILFIIGVAGVLTRRNLLVIFMSIELILNAANLNFIAFSRYLQDTGRGDAMAGQVFTVFVIVVAAAINGIFGRWLRFPEKLIGGIAVGSVALSFLISLTAVYAYGFSSSSLWPNPYVTTQTAFTWISGGAVNQSLGEGQAAAPQARTINVAGQPVTVSNQRASLLNVEWSYQLDPLSAIFMLVVTGVGLCIFVFATGYMHGETGFYRFFAYMGLFMFSMLVLVR